MSSQRLEIPFHTARLNQLLGCHWGTAHALKKRDQSAVAICAANASLEKATSPRKVSLFVWMGRKHRRPDPDAFWKSLLDALVACELLIDDSPRWCTLGDVTFGRAEKDSMLILLEDLPL